MSFPFRSYLNIKQTRANIDKSYLLCRPCIKNEILTLKNDMSWTRIILKKKFLTLEGAVKLYTCVVQLVCVNLHFCI